MPRAKDPKTERKRLIVKPSHPRPKRLRDRRKKVMEKNRKKSAKSRVNRRLRRME